MLSRVFLTHNCSLCFLFINCMFCIVGVCAFILKNFVASWLWRPSGQSSETGRMRLTDSWKELRNRRGGRQTRTKTNIDGHERWKGQTDASNTQDKWTRAADSSHIGSWFLQLLSKPHPANNVKTDVRWSVSIWVI